jgi:hypothetical protein
MPLNPSQLSKDQVGVDLIPERSTKERKLNKRRKTLMECISPKNSELCLQKYLAPPKNKSLMKPSIRGSLQRLSVMDQLKIIEIIIENYVMIFKS